MLRALAAKLPEDETMIAMIVNSSETLVIEEDGCCLDLFLDVVIVVVAGIILFGVLVFILLIVCLEGEKKINFMRARRRRATKIEQQHKKKVMDCKARIIH